MTLQANEKMVRKSLYRDGKMVPKTEMTEVVRKANLPGFTVKRGRLYKDGKNMSKAETMKLYFEVRAVAPVNDPVVAATPEIQVA